jgi:poly(hydroxyalkanoate) depolymerase family esterase
VLDIKGLLAKNGLDASGNPKQSSRLEEVLGFDANPGNLRMLRYVPKALARNPALLVVLHGCTQTAADYDRGAGWSVLADRFGFVLLFPEQQRANNPNGCFNWFRPADVRRGQGEVASINEMIARCLRDQDIDPGRIFVTGLSAGGAMASAMLACYPEVFAGGAIIAGLPFGAAASVQEALMAMSQSPSKPADEWGDLVRLASPHVGPWPRISVWHGSADATVVPANAREILKQWMNVHQVADGSVQQPTVDGIARRAWENAAGEEVLEYYAIPRMAHGTPLATGSGERQGGVAGPHMLEAGIYSSFHIARFFGLTGGRRAMPEVVGAPADVPDHVFRRDIRISVTPSAPSSIGAIIEDALRAAGLR